jgi:four helix bundle protein
MARPHYKLKAWKVAMDLVKSVYEVTRNFPKEEIYGLTAQMRRAAVSVPSNLAEGAARTGQKEFAQFLNVASGSLSELETQLLIAVELGYLEQNHSLLDHMDEASALLSGLRRSISK